MRFFFYGTLLDRDVTALVLGRRLPPQAYTAARLPGHARRRVKNATYPIAIPDRRAEVPGAIVGGLSRRDVARLSAYEGPGYRVVPLKVKVQGRMTEVSVFEPIQSRLQPSRELWDLALWQRRHKRSFVSRLKKAFSAPPAYSTP
ncbi:MAG: putative avirulence induced protein [Reyranella sp.]|nr:putative avirulence induced protein [Reyranella sp.]